MINHFEECPKHGKKYLVTAFYYDAFSGIFYRKEIVHGNSIDEVAKSFRKNNSPMCHILKIEQCV